MKKSYRFPRKRKKKEKITRPENVRLIRINDKTEVYLNADIPEKDAIKEYLEKIEHSNKQSNKKEINEEQKIREGFND